MMTRIIKSLGILAVVATIAIGATVAYFSDTETSAGNTITSGTLNLQLLCPPPVEYHADPLHPESGVDTTGMYTTYNLNQSDIAKLAVSDDSRYVTQYGWYTSYLSGTDTPESWSNPLEFVNFGIPNIPAGATITGTNLTFEWQRGSCVNAARLRIYDGSTWQIHNLSLPPADQDTTVTLDLKNDFGIDTVAELNALRVQFQATISGSGSCSYYPNTSSSKKTQIDLVEVNVNYTLTGQPYWCEDGLTETFVVSNVKPGDSGTEATINYRNNGSVGGTLKIKPIIVSEPENGRNSAEIAAGDTSDDVGELSQYLHLIINGTDAGTLASLATTAYTIGPVAGGASGSLTLNWLLPDTTGNVVQSDGVAFTLEFILEQQP